MDVNAIIAHPAAPTLLVAAGAYAVGWRLNRALVEAPPRLARWRRLLVPLVTLALGLGFGAAGTPGTGRWDLDLLLGLLAGAGPVVWAELLKATRKIRAEVAS